MRRLLWLATHGRLRRPNVRLVVCLLVAAAMLGVGAHLVHGFQCRRNANDLFERAKAAEEEGELKQTVSDLSRYLSLVPDDMDGMARFAMALDELASTPRERAQAYLAMEKVLREAPARQDVRRRLARLGMEGGRFADAADHLKILLKSSPDDAELHQWLGRCLERQGKYDEAVKEFRAAITHAPEQLENYIRLARLLRDRLDDPSNADALIDQMVASNEDSAKAYLWRASYRRVQKTDATAKRDEIATDVNRALELDATDADVLLVAAQWAEARGEFAEALERARVGLEYHPQDVRMYWTCARLELRAERPQHAIAHLHQGLARFPDEIKLRCILVDLLIEYGAQAEARGEIEQLRKPNVLPAVVDYFDARIAMAEGRWSQGVEILERVRLALVRSPEMTKRIDLLLGQCYGRLNDSERQMTAYRIALRADPLWTSARLGLASALLATGRTDEAMEEYRLALKVPPAQSFGWTEVARSLVLRNARLPAAQKDWREVDQVLAEATNASPDSAAVPLVRAKALWAQGQFEAAEEQVRAALAMRPSDTGLQQFGANFYLRIGQFVEAAKLLRRIIDPQANTPVATATWARRTLAALQGASGDYRQFREALELLEPRGDDEAAADDDRRIRAVLLAKRGGRRLQREAIAILEQLTERNPPMPAEQFLLAQLYEADENWPKAHDRMIHLLDGDGNNPEYVAHFVRSLLRRGSWDEAQPWLERLEQVQPSSLVTLELKVRILAAQGNKEEAVEMVEPLVRSMDAVSAYPPAIVEFLGGLLQDLGQLPAAEQMYRQYASQHPEAVLMLVAFLGRHGGIQEAFDLCERAWQNYPPSAVAAAALDLLRSDGFSSEHLNRVESWLEAAIKKSPNDASLLLCLAELRDNQERFEEAETVYRQVIKQDDRNFVALNNLAWLLAKRSDKPSDGLSMVNRAIDIAGPAGELLDTRACVYLAMGEFEMAIKDLQEAVSEVPKPTWYFHLAQAHAAVNNTTQAETALRQAQSFGLDTGMLHPLERSQYERLIAGL